LPFRSRPAVARTISAAIWLTSFLLDRFGIASVLSRTSKAVKTNVSIQSVTGDHCATRHAILQQKSSSNLDARLLKQDSQSRPLPKILTCFVRSEVPCLAFVFDPTDRHSMPTWVRRFLILNAQAPRKIGLASTAVREHTSFELGPGPISEHASKTSIAEDSHVSVELD